MNGGKFSEIKTQMDEYHKIYSNEASFTTELYQINDTAWSYIVLTLRPNADKNCMIWDYLDILLWMIEKVTSSVAYACSKNEGELPIIAYPDVNNKFGDSCNGIANGKYFRASIPDREAKWGQSVPEGFDYVGYLRENYGIDVSMM